jgi:outer membrane murein-binding lipoprotein Lpp
MGDNEKGSGENHGNVQGQDSGTEDGSKDEIRINQVISTAVKAELKKLFSGKEISGLLAPIVLDAVRAANVANEKPASVESKPNGSDTSKPNPEVAALKQQIQQMQEESERAKKDAQKAKKKQRNERTLSQIKDLLASNNVRPEMVDMLAKVLFKADNRVEFGDDGRPLLRVKVSPAKGFAEEDQLMPLENGIKQYLKSKEAASFLVAPGGAATRQEPQRKAIPVVTPSQVPSYESAPLTEVEKARRATEQMAALGVSL